MCFPIQNNKHKKEIELLEELKTKIELIENQYIKLEAEFYEVDNRVRYLDDKIIMLELDLNKKAKQYTNSLLKKI